MNINDKNLCNNTDRHLIIFFSKNKKSYIIHSEHIMFYLFIIIIVITYRPSYFRLSCNYRLYSIIINIFELRFFCICVYLFVAIDTYHTPNTLHKFDNFMTALLLLLFFSFFFSGERKGRKNYVGTLHRILKFL